MFFFFLSSSSFVSVWCAFVLKNDLKTSPPKSSFLKIFEFFNKQTTRHFFAVLYTRSRTTHTQTFREEEEEEEEERKREKRLNVVVSEVYMEV